MITKSEQDHPRRKDPKMVFERHCDCKIPEIFIDFLLNAKYLYCCTLDQQQRPHVVPLLFTFYESEHLILCVTGRNSTKFKNLNKNPYASFSTDNIHPSNPLLNTGIMIETVVQLSKDPEEIDEVMKRLHNKYANIDDSSLIGRFYESETLIKALPLKMVYWKGPHFQRFICKEHRKEGKPYWHK